MENTDSTPEMSLWAWKIDVIIFRYFGSAVSPISSVVHDQLKNYGHVLHAYATPIFVTSAMHSYSASLCSVLLLRWTKGIYDRAMLAELV